MARNRPAHRLGLGLRPRRRGPRRRGARARALELLEEALAIDPGYADAHRSIGDVYAGLGRHRDALDHRLRALELEPAR